MNSWWFRAEMEIVKKALKLLGFPFWLEFLRNIIARAFVSRGLVTGVWVKFAGPLGGAGETWLIMQTKSYGDRRGTRREILYRNKKRFEGEAIALILPLPKERKS